MVAANYSPGSDDDINFLIIQGKLALSPKIKVTGWAGWSLHYSTSGAGRGPQYALYRNDSRSYGPNDSVKFGELRDKVYYWNDHHANDSMNSENVADYYTIGNNDKQYFMDGGDDYVPIGDSWGYKIREFWKNTGSATAKPVPDPYELYMYPFEDYNNYHAYDYNYTADWNDQDQYKKFPVLECQLKIGDKYCVEITEGLLKENPKYQWMTLDQCPYRKDGDGNQLDTKKTTFTIGFDPEIGQPIIGKEYDLCNTVEGKYSEKTGTAIPIRKSDRLSGALEFKIIGIVGTQWDNITKRDPDFWHHTKWYHNYVNIMEHVSAIWIKDFKIVPDGTNDKSAIGASKNKDILYVSDEERKYIKTKDDIEFKINTALSNEEAQELDIDNTISTSYVTDLDTSLNLVGVSQYEDSSVFRPEKLYVDQYYNYYNAPKVILETDIWDTSTGSYNSLNTYQINGFGKMMATDITRDLRNNSVKVKMRQI